MSVAKRLKCVFVYKAPIEKGLCTHINTHICTFGNFPTDMGVPHKATKEIGVCKPPRVFTRASQSPYREGASQSPS